MKLLTDIENFVSGEIQKIEGDLGLVEQKIENAASIANNAVNGLKDFIASPEGKTIRGVISAIPGVGGVVDELLGFLPVLVQGLGWVTAEFEKSPAQLLQDGITKAVTVVDPDIKASNLITLQAHIDKFVSGLQGSPQSIQTTMSTAPTIYATSRTLAVGTKLGDGNIIVN